MISTIQEINHIRPTLPGPSVKISVIPSKFHKHVSVIGFLDTGAQHSMLNPKILPLDYWDNHIEYFRAANGNFFETSLITKKPSGIRALSESFEGECSIHGYYGDVWMEEMRTGLFIDGWVRKSGIRFLSPLMCWTV